MITLPHKFLTRLTIACGVMFALYVMMVIVTICFASYQTELSQKERIQEAAVVALETEYYAAIDTLSASNPTAEGYVTPSRVEYVAATGLPTVTRADR